MTDQQPRGPVDWARQQADDRAHWERKYAGEGQ